MQCCNAVKYLKFIIPHVQSIPLVLEHLAKWGNCIICNLTPFCNEMTGSLAWAMETEPVRHMLVLSVLYDSVRMPLHLS